MTQNLQFLAKNPKVPNFIPAIFMNDKLRELVHDNWSILPYIVRRFPFMIAQPSTVAKIYSCQIGKQAIDNTFVLF